MTTNVIPLSTAASLYGLSELELQPLQGGHFTHVYGFQRQGKKYVLRLTPPDPDNNVQAQPAILAWMAYLAAHGAFVPAPLPSRNGKLVEVLPSPDGEWLAVAFTHAEGVLSEELPLDQLGNDEFQMLGMSIGKMHSLARGSIPSQDVRFEEWDTADNLFSHRIMRQHWLKERQARLLEQLQSLPRPVEAYGLVHCDLHFGNFFVDLPGQRITLIDFDDTTYGWFVMDVAVLLFDILVLYTGSDKDQYAQNFLHNFATGYLAENPLPRFWWEQLPLFLKLLEINVYDVVAGPHLEEAGEWTRKFMSGRKERLENDLPYVNLDYSAWKDLL